MSRCALVFLGIGNLTQASTESKSTLYAYMPFNTMKEIVNHVLRNLLTETANIDAPISIYDLKFAVT